MDFYELDLEDEVLDGLDALNFVETSPIQSETIPPLLEGRDVIGCAQTGSGKTAAYLLPFLNKVARQELPKDVYKRQVTPFQVSGSVVRSHRSQEGDQLAPSRLL